MKLQRVRAGRAETGRTAHLPAVSVCFTNGTLSFNQAARVALDIDLGDCVAFYRDADSPDRDWRIAKRRIAGSLKLTRECGNSLCGVGTALTRELLASIGARHKKRFVIATQPEKGGYRKIVGAL